MNLCLHVVLCAASGCKHLRLYNIISVRFMLLCMFIFFTRVRACCRPAVQRTAYRRVIVVRPLPIYYFITSNDCFIDVCHLRQGSLCDRSCLSVCERDSTESRGRIWVNFSVFPPIFWEDIHDLWERSFSYSGSWVDQYHRIICSRWSSFYLWWTDSENITKPN